MAKTHFSKVAGQQSASWTGNVFIYTKARQSRDQKLSILPLGNLFLKTIVRNKNIKTPAVYFSMLFTTIFFLN
jgi:hypothetical protein